MQNKRMGEWMKWQSWSGRSVQWLIVVVAEESVLRHSVSQLKNETRLNEKPNDEK